MPRRRRVLAHLPAAMKLRAKLRAHAEPWIADLAWPFPTWTVRRRPFDWAEDEADVPVPPSPPSWSVPDRQQADIYLRPPAAVVRS